MSTEENKAIARRFAEELDRRQGPAEELCAPSFTAYFPGNPPMNLAAYKQFDTMFYSAFPDLKHTVEDIIAEGDKVAVRVTVRGTHKGELMGIPPTGKQVEIPAIAIFRVASGKLAEQWTEVDLLGLMQQIGAVPAPA